MSFQRSPVWRYPIFQIPALFSAVCFGVALLTYGLGWFLPPISVYIGLDLSQQTRETSAVQAYIERNQTLKNPNALALVAFGQRVVPITQGFTQDGNTINQTLVITRWSDLARSVGRPSNPNVVVQAGLDSLSGQINQCKQILIFTDGTASPDSTLMQRARSQRVQVNFLVVGQPSAELLAAALSTRGVAVPLEFGELGQTLSQEIFSRFNNNSLVVFVFAGVGWVLLMFAMILPIERLLKSSSIRAQRGELPWRTVNGALQFSQGSMMGLIRSQAGYAGWMNAVLWTAITLWLFFAVWKVNEVFGC